ncbi:MAG: indole-3-glycerol phosphate synthase TrpC [Ignavibacteria bacterium]|jgi:indole-3-glycerol phosphate synthase|nr:indole-3-glycerol phosphate synthase TrpC [Ignavibacteria bacterium]MCU7505148.1 indole-3-glycerol phosphate synthase TrpC [Ignavibacteria bacterium]MCU7517999.1 indole-3-glycerol phosphate synthase TrpC [Ignavibacteria bacterium]
MNILDKILEEKKEEVKSLRSSYRLCDFYDSPFYGRSALSLKGKIEGEKNLSIIAEVKKASPSKGLIKKDFNHLEIANIYMQQGASAISVLTDKKFFQGSIEFLKDIAAVRTVPLLRKDFIIDVFQVHEARASGADAILLIAEALSKGQISELTNAASEAGLEVLLEIHSERQLDKIDFSVNGLIGINNRNLETFVTDLNTTLGVSAALPDDVVIVSESGISSPESVEIIKKTRAGAILVGEHLMGKDDAALALRELKQWCHK